MTEQKQYAHTLTLSSDREIVMERVFDAPRELVFRAMTNPELVPKWWGQRHSTTIIDTFDMRPGGKWRFIQRMPDGTELAFRGEVREVVPPERIVQTFEFEPMAGHISEETMTLETVEGGKTKLTVRSRFSSVEDRDGMLASGMEAGAAETYDRLAELLATMTAGQ